MCDLTVGHNSTGGIARSKADYSQEKCHEHELNFKLTTQI